MPQVHYYSYFEVTTAQGSHLKGGSLQVPQRITVDGDYLDLRQTLATSTTWDAWATGTEEPVTDFDFLFLESDQDVFLELVVDTAGDVGQEEIAFKVRANVPFVMAYDDAKALYSEDFAAGTDDQIEQLRVRNESGSSAKVRLVLVT